MSQLRHPLLHGGQRDGEQLGVEPGAGLARPREQDLDLLSPGVDLVVALVLVVLQPGEYIIRLPNAAASVNMVQVLSADEKNVVTTVQGVAISRKRITQTTEFWFWKTPKGKPRVVRAWFYPGDTAGVEIVSKNHR